MIRALVQRAAPGRVACLLAVLACAASTAAAAAPDDVFDYPDGLTIAGADTIRTNLWVAEALMGETVAVAERHLPPPPLAVVLVPADKEQRTNLLTTMITERLTDAGYRVHLDEAPADSTAHHCELRYQVIELMLGYPASGRRFGLWRDWVARDMSFTALYTIVETPGGEVLFNDRVCRTFRDRVPSDDLAACQSPAYPFTRAEVKSGGWQRRVEEIVVLGALAGLVAVYFQNTD